MKVGDLVRTGLYTSKDDGLGVVMEVCAYGNETKRQYYSGWYNIVLIRDGSVKKYYKTDLEVIND